MKFTNATAINIRKKKIAKKKFKNNHMLAYFYQQDMINHLSPHNIRIINSPTASGKTFVTKALSIIDGAERKTIISPPQCSQANGFIKNNLIHFNGKGHRFKMGILDEYNLIHGNLSERTKKDQGIKFLKDKNAKVLLCTHQTLCAIWKELKKTNNKRLIKQVSLFLDEGHHLAVDDTRDTNVLGEMVDYGLSARGKQMGLTILTATFFRHDRRTVLSDKYEKQAQRYDITFDEYLSTLEYMKKIEVTVSLFNEKPSESLRSYHRRHGKGIEAVYLPKVSSDTSIMLGGKNKIVEDIMGVYGKTWNYDETTGVYTSGSGKKLFDLVEDNPTKRSRIDKHITRIDVSDSKQMANTLIALERAKEGADYPLLDTIHIIGFRNSFVEFIQIFGRLLRDVKGKETIRVNIVLAPSKDDSIRDKMNHYLHAIFLTMMLEEVVTPSIVNGRGNSSSNYILSMMSYDLYVEVMESLLTLNDEDSDFTDKFYSIMDRHNITDPILLDALWNIIIGKLNRLIKANYNYDMEPLGDLDPLTITQSMKNGLKLFMGGALDVNSFDEYRKFIVDKNITLLILQDILDYKRAYSVYPTCKIIGSRSQRNLGKFISFLRDDINFKQAQRLLSTKPFHDIRDLIDYAKSDKSDRAEKIRFIMDFCLKTHADTKGKRMWNGTRDRKDTIEGLDEPIRVKDFISNARTYSDANKNALKATLSEPKYAPIRDKIFKMVFEHKKVDYNKTHIKKVKQIIKYYLHDDYYCWPNAREIYTDEVRTLGKFIGSIRSAERGVGNARKLSQDAREVVIKKLGETGLHNLLNYSRDGTIDGRNKRSHIDSALSTFKEYVESCQRRGKFPTNVKSDPEVSRLAKWAREMPKRGYYTNPKFRKECHKINSEIASSLSIPKFRKK